MGDSIVLVEKKGHPASMRSAQCMSPRREKVAATCYYGKRKLELCGVLQAFHAKAGQLYGRLYVSQILFLRLLQFFFVD